MAISTRFDIIINHNVPVSDEHENHVLVSRPSVRAECGSVTEDGAASTQRVELRLENGRIGLETILPPLRLESYSPVLNAIV